MNQWSMVYHRIKAAEENAAKDKPGTCDCKDCREYMAERGLDTKGREVAK